MNRTSRQHLDTIRYRTVRYCTVRYWIFAAAASTCLLRSPVRLLVQTRVLDCTGQYRTVGSGRTVLHFLFDGLEVNWALVYRGIRAYNTAFLVVGKTGHV